MMGERRVAQAALFYEFSLEERIQQATCCGRLIALSNWAMCGVIWLRITARRVGHLSILS